MSNRTTVDAATARRIARIQARKECDQSRDDLAEWRKGRAAEIMKLGATRDEIKLAGD